MSINFDSRYQRSFAIKKKSKRYARYEDSLNTVES